MRSRLLVLVILAACGGEEGQTTMLPAANYQVEVVSSMADIGQVLAFNADGHIVSHSDLHGWAVIDVDTREFAQITAMTGFVGFNDVGELVYSNDQVGATRYLLRRDNGVGTESEIPRILNEGLEFTPFTLENDGAWGFTERANPGAAVTPGFGRFAVDHVEQFHDWAGHEPTRDIGQGPRGVDAMGRAVFCENAIDNSGENGLPITHCRIVAADNTLTELGTDVPDFWSVLSLQPITPGGRLGGSVAVGISGFGGTFPALFTDGVTEILGDKIGEVIGLTDRGDVIFTQHGVPQSLRVRTPLGDVLDLSPYVRNPSAPAAEVLGTEVLAIAPDGRILVNHQVPGMINGNVELLTPM